MKLSETTIISQQQKELETLVETKIVHVLGGRKAKANLDFQMRFTTTVEFLHDFYEYFNITVYSELKIIEFECAKKYVLDWVPKTNIKIQIDNINQKGAKLC